MDKKPITSIIYYKIDMHKCNNSDYNGSRYRYLT